ncbi:MAG: hypothetical protein U1F25_01540 [Rubrivivax sp.]
MAVNRRAGTAEAAAVRIAEDGEATGARRRQQREAEVRSMFDAVLRQ